MSINLHDVLKKYVQEFLRNNKQEDVTGLYHTFMGETESVLIECVLEHTNGNQSAASQLLGINRNTLRSKMNKK